MEMNNISGGLSGEPFEPTSMCNRSPLIYSDPSVGDSLFEGRTIRHNKSFGQTMPPSFTVDQVEKFIKHIEKGKMSLLTKILSL